MTSQLGVVACAVFRRTLCVSSSGDKTSGGTAGSSSVAVPIRQTLCAKLHADQTQPNQSIWQWSLTCDLCLSFQVGSLIPYCVFSPIRGNARGGSSLTSPTGTPICGRHGRQLPIVPSKGPLDRSAYISQMMTQINQSADSSLQLQQTCHTYIPHKNLLAAFYRIWMGL